MNWPVRVYSLLLHLYPSDFRDEFGEEMTAVFIQALSDAQKQKRSTLLIWYEREFTSMFAGLVREQWSSLRREDAVIKPMTPINDTYNADDVRAETPLAIFAGLLPFILFGLLYTLKGATYPTLLPWKGNGIVVSLIFHAILIVGLGIGWALRFPRWSYPYFGVVLISSYLRAGSSTPGFHMFGYTFGREQWGWRGWVPLLVLAVVMLLLTHSLQPLARLVQGIRRDWTRLSFAIYAALTWLFLGVTADGKTWYNDTRYLPLNLFLLTLAITGGAFFYMRGRRLWPRALALEIGFILCIFISALVTSLDGHSEFGSPSTAVGWYFFLLIWLMWLSVTLWPGLASQVWQRFRSVA